jgi:hypothetical protein
MNLNSLEKARAVAEEKYVSARKKLADPSKLSDFCLVAQEAQNAWDEFKKLDTELSNVLVLKKMSDLYGI